MYFGGESLADIISTPLLHAKTYYDLHLFFFIVVYKQKSIGYIGNHC